MKQFISHHTDLQAYQQVVKQKFDHRSSRLGAFGLDIISIIIFSGESSQFENFAKSICKIFEWYYLICHGISNALKQIQSTDLVTFRLWSVKISSRFWYDAWTSRALVPPNPHTSTCNTEASVGRNP